MRYYLPIELSPDNVAQIRLGDVARLQSRIPEEHTLTEVDKMHAMARGAGVKIGIVDTGIGDHIDLDPSRVIRVTQVGHPGPDGHGHGTHVAGILGSGGNSGRTKGTAPESIVYCAKGLTDQGWGEDWTIVDCILYLVNIGVDVISLSIGGDGRSEPIAGAVRTAQEKGCIVVAASGNGGNAYPRDSYPGGLPDVITVGACDNQGRLASFSQPSNSMDVIANGVNYLSCYPGQRFARMSGTSMSTPHVAGAVACLISYAKGLGMAPRTDDMQSLIIDTIMQTCEDAHTPGHDKLTGAGVPKLTRAIEYIQNELIGKTPPPTDPKDPAEEIIIEIDKAKHKNIRNINIKFI